MNAVAKGRWVLVSAAVGITAFGGAFAWRQKVETQRLLQAVPALPGARTGNRVLEEKLRVADAKVRSNPWDARAQEELAKLYHANGYFAEAGATWAILRVLEPGEPRWPYYQADVDRSISRYAEMVAALEETVALAPDYAPAWLQLGDYAFKTGDLATARQRYERRLELVPEDPYARLGLARVVYQQGKTEEGMRLVAKLVEQAPGFPSAHNWYAELLAKAGRQAEAEEQRIIGRGAGRFKEAADAWLFALRDACYDPDRLFALGTIEYQTEQGDRGLKRFQRAVEIAPEDLHGLEMLADLYSKTGDNERARVTLEDYLKRAGSNPVPPAVHVALSETWRRLGNARVALRVAQEGLLQHPREPVLHNAEGSAWMDLDDVGRAIASFRRALAIDPDDPEANYNLGSALLSAGEMDDGIGHLEHALVRKPRFVSPLLLLGRVALDQKRNGAAEEYLRKAYRAQPNLPDARQGLAAALLALGADAEKAGDRLAAERFYREGIELHPESAPLAGALGGILLLQERFNEALPILENFRRFAPNNAQAPFFLAQAQMRLGHVPEAISLLEEAERIAQRTGQRAIQEFCREILSKVRPSR